MRPFVTTSIRWFVALALSCFALPGDAQQSTAPRRSTGIDFTEPKSSTTTSTNQTDSKEKPLELLGLDAPIRKPFSPFGDAADSFSGVGAPPPRRYAPTSAAETKRRKEALDLKKNWAFATPEEMFGVAGPDEELGTGLEDTPSTAMERYLERQENKRTSAISNRMKDDSLHDIFRTEQEEEEDQQKLTREEKPIFGFLADRNGQILDGDLKIPSVSGFNEPIGNLGATAIERAKGGDFDLGQPAKLESSLVRNALREESMKRYQEELEVHSFTLSAPSAPPAVNSTLGSSPLQSGLPQPQPFALGNVSTTPSSFAPPPTTFGAALPSLTPAQSFVPPPAPAQRITPAPVFELPMRRF